jgi:hypothetical protein
MAGVVPQVRSSGAAADATLSLLWVLLITSSSIIM